MHRMSFGSRAPSGPALLQELKQSPSYGRGRGGNKDRERKGKGRAEREWLGVAHLRKFAKLAPMIIAGANHP